MILFSFLFFSFERNRVDKHENDDWKFPPTDNAYPTCYYRTPRIRVTDAIQFHKELHHPTMLDAPNVSLNMAVEMDMEGDKPTRLVSNFQKLVNIQHTFDHGQKHSILVFAKEEVRIRKTFIFFFLSMELHGIVFVLFI